MQYICEKTKMSILVVGTVAFDAIETKHGKTDKIVGGAATIYATQQHHFQII